MPNLTTRAAATTPLDGTELAYVVQGGADAKVSVADLTAGRNVDGSSFTVTGSAIPVNGHYLPAANTVGLAINSVEAWRVNSSRNFLLGASAAATGNPRLDVVTGSGGVALCISDSVTDATNKVGRFGVRHYTNTEEPAAMIVVTSSSGSTSINFGGGTALFNAVTNGRLYAAANNTTTTGTSIVEWDISGFYPAADNSFTLGASSLGFSNVFISKTITPAATVGAQTINKNAGSVNFAAAATSLVVTNSRVTANSIVVATVATNDATMTSVQAVPGAGSFTLFANAAATAETRVNFLVIN